MNHQTKEGAGKIEYRTLTYRLDQDLAGAMLDLDERFRKGWHPAMMTSTPFCLIVILKKGV